MLNALGPRRVEKVGRELDLSIPDVGAMVAFCG